MLGKGKRLFGEGAIPSGLKLISCQSYPTGVIFTKYVPHGDVKTGDFTLPEPSAAATERRKNLT